MMIDELINCLRYHTLEDRSDEDLLLNRRKIFAFKTRLTLNVKSQLY